MILPGTDRAGDSDLDINTYLNGTPNHVEGASDGSRIGERHR
jgi:hypothetical protein